MLNAERVALQTRVVQQLAEVKKQEIDYLLRRYGSLGLMAAFITEITMEILLEKGQSAMEDRVAISLRVAFIATSLICVLANMWVILCTLLIGNWAPGLALRGPRGSLNRVFDALVSERRQINFWFVTGIASFALQMAMAFWLLEYTNPDFPADPNQDYLADPNTNTTSRFEFKGFGLSISIQLLLGTLFAIVYLRSMRHVFSLKTRKQREHDSMSQKMAESQMPEGHEAVSAAEANGSAAAKKPKRRMSMLDNPVADAMGADVGLGPTAYKRTAHDHPRTVTFGETHEQLTYAGTLYKRQRDASEKSTGWRRGIFKARSLSRELVVGAWNLRYFVLRDGQLAYWHNEQDHQLGKAPEKEISLRGYEVLINTTDASWGFELRPLSSDTFRTWWFRAHSEDERLEWVERLVAASFIQ